MLNKSWNY